ncbi:MerR family transcriptional regulator [Rhodococcus sp. Leaf278]|uniref:MerR family transcriptional regulator n=1 Tax=Rhodococcus sp. Leaf278 TaxID=1736319 RepID=UPI00070996C0|nr:MerR family transcriptional regulator [Rhodococcus sp. Leaf278]KQU53319.1 MerR family transcriptional regulator [Rhodococcus sp. Leaf278]
MRIGEVARLAGVSTRALRYYEEQGLLTSERTFGEQRIYPESAVERVKLLQQLFAAGLSSKKIVQLLPCIDSGQSSPEAFEIMRVERERITSAMADLAATRDVLDQMIDIAHNPTPEHCPALRDTPWGPLESGTSAAVSRSSVAV